ncbi:MAG TPA: CBS domain-containing protein [Roseiflexaceae bacterium]|nr:CBS domain-containing protein [Roseiflexaceae bacterium]
MPFYGHRVKEFMRRELVSCRAATPIDLLADRLHANDSTLLLVVDDDGYALGTVSENDLLVAQRRNSTALAGEIMQQPAATCLPETPLREAVTRMYRNRVDHLLVVKPGEERFYPMGIICMSDVVRRLVEQSTARETTRNDRAYRS